MLKGILTVVFTTLFLVMQAQNTDSLLQLTTSTEANVQIDAYVQLSNTYLDDSLALAKSYGIEAYMLSKTSKNKVGMAKAAVQLAKIMHFEHNADSANFYIRQAEEIYEKQKMHGPLYQLKYYIARYYHDHNQIDTAIVLYKSILKYARGNWDSTKLADILQQTAQCHFLQSKYKEVINYLDEKREIVEALGDSLELANTYNDLSTNQRRLGNYTQAIEYTQKAIQIFENLNNEIGVAECYSSMGSVYYYMDDNTQAIKHFINSLEIFKQHNRTDRMAALNNNIGSVYIENKDFNSAKHYFEAALELYSSMNHHYAEAIISDNLGLVYLGLNENKKALEYFEQSYQMQKLIGNSEGMIHSMTNIAGVYAKQKMLIKAEELYYNALDMAIEEEYANEQLNIYKELIELEEGLGNYKKALNTMRHYHALKDTLITRESRTQLNEMQAKLDLIEHQNEIKLLNKENELTKEKMAKQRIYMTAVIIILTLVVILTIIVIIALSFTRKAKRKLQWQNQHIIEQRNKIQLHNKQMTDSIQYASRVQNALFSPVDNLSAFFKEYFLISKPHSIVSGDFYWVKPIKNSLYIAVADCTGHGVPGAFMSVLGNTLLNQIINSIAIGETGKVLNQLREKVKTSLHQTDMQGSTDGMDIALCCINFEKQQLTFSGAYNSAYLIRNNKLTELKADKMSVAISRKEQPFSEQKMHFMKGDMLYLATDGYYDQFGGDDYQKITRAQFKNLLLSFSHHPLNEQSRLLGDYFENWKHNNEQTDDMMVLGILL